MKNSNKGVIFCPRCGARNLVGAKFCIHCGYSLVGIKVDNSVENTQVNEHETVATQQAKTKTSSVEATSTRKRKPRSPQWKPAALLVLGLFVIVLGVISWKTLLESSVASKSSAGSYSYYYPLLKNHESLRGMSDENFYELKLASDKKTASVLMTSTTTISVLDFKVKQNPNKAGSYEGILDDATFFFYGSAKGVNATSLFAQGKLPMYYANPSFEELSKKYHISSKYKPSLLFTMTNKNHIKLDRLDFVSDTTEQMQKVDGARFDSAKKLVSRFRQNEVQKQTYASFNAVTAYDIAESEPYVDTSDEKPKWQSNGYKTYNIEDNNNKSHPMDLADHGWQALQVSKDKKWAIFTYIVFNRYYGIKMRLTPAYPEGSYKVNFEKYLIVNYRLP